MVKSVSDLLEIIQLAVTESKLLLNSSGTAMEIVGKLNLDEMYYFFLVKH